MKRACVKQDRRFQAAYDAGVAQAFCRLFGPENIVENLGELLGYVMPPERSGGIASAALMCWRRGNGHDST